MFGGKEFQNPRARRAATAAAEDIYDPQHGITSRPADAPADPAPAAPAPAPAPQPAQPTAEQELEDRIAAASYFPEISYKGHGIVILYHMDENAAPITFDQVIARWRALPAKMRFDPLMCTHLVYCYTEDGHHAKDTVPPEGFCKDALGEHDKEVRAIMDLLTGKKPEPDTDPNPADPKPAPATIQKALQDMTPDDFKQLFESMSTKKLHKVIDAAHAVVRARKEQAKNQSGSTGAEPKTGESADPKPAPAPAAPAPASSAPPATPAPAPAPAPAPQPAPKSASERYAAAGW